MERYLDQFPDSSETGYKALTMAKPAFIIIGAMKCATSTLAAQLGAQPGLFMTDPKEPNYFSDDPVFARGPEWYASLFAGAAAGDIKGEASTHYTKMPTYPATLDRMKAALPELRLVYMIRNPIPRIVSHYIHEWSQGVVAGSLEDALTSMPELVDYGRYGWQIAPFVEAYGRDAILLTSLERLKLDQTAELARVAGHLGHTGPTAWVEDLSEQNVSADRVRRLPLQGLIVDNPVATALRRVLVPKALRTRIRNARKMPDRPQIPDHMLPGLQARFAEDRKLLTEFFPEDPTLDLAYPFL
jgi:hypothetical protein